MNSVIEKQAEYERKLKEGNGYDGIVKGKRDEYIKEHLNDALNKLNSSLSKIKVLHDFLSDEDKEKVRSQLKSAFDSLPDMNEGLNHDEFKIEGLESDDFEISDIHMSFGKSHVKDDRMDVHTEYWLHTPYLYRGHPVTAFCTGAFLTKPVTDPVDGIMNHPFDFTRKDTYGVSDVEFYMNDSEHGSSKLMDSHEKYGHQMKYGVKFSNVEDVDGYEGSDKCEFVDSRTGEVVKESDVRTGIESYVDKHMNVCHLLSREAFSDYVDAVKICSEELNAVCNPDTVDHFLYDLDDYPTYVRGCLENVRKGRVYCDDKGRRMDEQDMSIYYGRQLEIQSRIDEIDAMLDEEARPYGMGLA